MKRNVHFLGNLLFWVIFTIGFYNETKASDMVNITNSQLVRISSQLEEIISSEKSLGEKVNLDLFVMSYCTYGLKAEIALIPYVKQHLEDINLNIYYIAEETASGKFESLHGKAEIEENIRQLIVKRLYPNQYLDYLLLRAESFNTSNWEEIATSLDFDIEQIKLQYSNPEIESEFRKNINISHQKDISASPSLLLNNKELNNVRLYTNSLDNPIMGKCTKEGEAQDVVIKVIDPLIRNGNICSRKVKYQRWHCQKNKSGELIWVRGQKGEKEQPIACPEDQKVNEEYWQCQGKKKRIIKVSYIIVDGVKKGEIKKKGEWIPIQECMKCAERKVIPNDDALCDDGDPCTKNDRCINGICVGDPVTSSENPNCGGK